MDKEILNSDGSRNYQANILLDNVKRLEQENEKLKKELEKHKSMIAHNLKPLFDSDFQDKLKELEQENEKLKSNIYPQTNYTTQKFYTKEEYDKLQAENERLKEELRTEKIYSSQIEELEESLQYAKAENEHYRKEAYRLADELNKTENLAFTYKQALQEIREIARKTGCMRFVEIVDKVIGAEE